ncbi:phosphoribosylformylglycinamidine synthase subunit PurS [Bacillus sp. J14TS2]|uniref:phosphoribosylformylglycinamidine synthase subunit PurS n=1 Tax=Bacillus sp. J14TS2 TaxID=2807188 RepID=UPI001B258B31|nr:phosphoribosylformylglycinamidine synthase subunit PurS [Bacillus sp. J14TS2]GIN73276.1 phosphoribosylformylglycinamidine synthase subunit PurS [Bacillus sp. J14TS2]
MTYKVKVFVTLKESVIDPQGSAATKALQKSGYPTVKEVRVGKLIELQVEETEGDLSTTIDEICKKLLVNLEVEEYSFEIEEGAAQ